METVNQYEMQENFSCDLVKESKSHVAFLQTLHLNGISIQQPTVETLRRYSELWLPLVHRHHINTTAKNNDSGYCESSEDEELGLIPPGDIAWLWHCHRLAPYRYVKHVQQLFLGLGEDETKNASFSAKKDLLLVLDPKHPFVVQLQDNAKNVTFDQSKHADAARYTQTLWEEVYPKEPFFFIEEAEEQQQHSSTNNSEKSENQTIEKTTPHTLSGFDVLESCQRQATFLWQVSQINFHDDDFLRQGVQNYYKFMSLMKMGDKKPRFLVPTYQIDLMWHTHILHSIRFYHRDCMNNIQS
jgi:hypothetical protein